MRRSSSTTSRCGASSGSVAGSVIAKAPPPSLGPTFSLAAGALNQTQYPVTVVGVDHGGEKSASGIMCIRPEFAERAADPLRLQSCQLEREGFAFRRDIEQALAPILRAFLLRHVTLIDQLL